MDRGRNKSLAGTILAAWLNHGQYELARFRSPLSSLADRKVRSTFPSAYLSIAYIVACLQLFFHLSHLLGETAEELRGERRLSGSDA